MTESIAAEALELFASVGGRVARRKERCDPASGESLPDLVKTGDGEPLPAGEAERVERAAPQAFFDLAKQVFGRVRLALEGAGEKPFRNRALKRCAVGGDPGAATAELLGKVGRDDAVRRKGETDQARGRLFAASGYAGSRPPGREIFRKRIIAQLRQRPPPLAPQRLRPRPCRDLPGSPIRPRCARA